MPHTAPDSAATAQFPAVHDTPARSAWTWRRVVLALVLAGDLIYATLVLVAIIAKWQWLPQPASGFATGTLVAATVITFAGVRHARINDRLDESVVIVGGVAAAVSNELEHVKTAIAGLAGEVSRIRERPTRRLGDETTVRLNGQAQGQAYASAAMLSGGRIDSIAEAQQGLYAAVAKIGVELGQVRQLVDQRAGAGAPRRRRSRNGNGTPEQRAIGQVPIDEKFQAYLAGREDRHINGTGDEERP